MRTIDKRAAPSCIADLRREARRIERETGRPPVGSDWDPGDCAKAIRHALHAEQGGLCAYCMQRIKPHGYRANLHGRGGMKIEHWEDRSKHPRRMYDWDNLLGVCSGEFQGAELVEHCDTKRKAEPLRVNPGTKEPPRPEDVFAFKSSPPGPPSSPARPGIWIHAIDPDAGNDIETLGLNADHLVQNRHSTIQQLRLSLGRRGKRGETAVGQLLRSRLIAATRPGPNGLPPFAPLVADYIRKKMRAKGIEP